MSAMSRTSSAAPIYPVDPWLISETALRVEHHYRNETIFALGNGHLGLRGTFEEGYSGPAGTSCDGTYLNGFFESEPIVYPEPAHGYAEHGQTILNVANGKAVQIWAGSDPVDLLSGHLLSYRRTLDMRSGVLIRDVTWRSPAGHELRLQIERLVSLPRPHLAAIRLTVTALNGPLSIRFDSRIDGDVQNLSASRDPRTGSRFGGRVLEPEQRSAAGGRLTLTQRTRHTRFLLACAVEHATNGARLANCRVDPLQVAAEFTSELTQGASVTLDKFMAYTSSRDLPDDAVLAEAQAVASRAQADGFERVRAEQAAFVADFWEHADIELEGDDALQQGLRFNLFHLLQSAGRDGRTSIAAKGVTGEGYEGHYFWDTEMYVDPVFTHTLPIVARRLIEYRIRTLDKARERARQMAHPVGALFPWRTIDGDECSAYFPAGTAQYHINADVAYALKAYVESTGDTDLLVKGGAELLAETARLWLDAGDFIADKGGKFCINAVTGPDEYTAIVDNNVYTNLMAELNLRYAADVFDELQREQPAVWADLVVRLGLGPDEPTAWRAAADQMYIPYDAERGLYPADEAFFNRAPWDFANTPADHYPLLLHYHPLIIYRHQVCKQADLVLALFLRGERFTLDEKRRNYDFYEPLTTHDSSLSTCIFSIVASEIGYADKAYDYFMRTARLDLDDTHGNVKDGVHIANMAGTWMGVVMGFAGLRVRGGHLHFDPNLPARWSRYSFRISHLGRRLRVTVSADGATYELLSGDPLQIWHRADRLPLAPGSVVRAAGAAAGS
jgi:alpha,alpha-trehalose phosphorylase